MNVIDEHLDLVGDRIFLNGSINKNLSDDFLHELNHKFKNSYPDEVLEWGFRIFGNDMVVGTGFGPSGMVLIHRLVQKKISAPVFYIDTQLLFEETYTLRDEIEERFGIRILQIKPDLSLKDQAATHGDELWKSNPDKCCYIRKVLPLQSYLSDKKAWVTGIRRSQSDTRRQTDVIEWDPTNHVVKINPLANWSGTDVWDYIHEHDLPYNPLHDFGYPSIGCVPCTHAVSADEDERSGRWKNRKKIECGIHLPAQHLKNTKKR